MEKWAVITGASSGIGLQLTRLYAKRGYNIVLAARRAERLYALAEKLDTQTRVIPCDLSYREQCFELYNKTSDLDIELVINCAGFGAVGKFETVSIERQIEMTDINCIAPLILTQLYLKDFKRKNSGTILNVASSAGLMPGGANMAAYYATKAYLVSLTNSISEELRQEHSGVKIAALCPGPVKTEFDDVAGVKFSLSGIKPEYCAKCAARGLDKGETIIIPEDYLKYLSVLARVLPQRLVLKITGFMQKRKI